MAALIAAGIGAAGSIAGGLAAASGSAPSKIRPGKVRKAALKNKASLLFGGEGTPGLDISTPFSSVDAGTGEVSVDPLGRKLRMGALSGFEGKLGDTRRSLLGNKGAFQQARVNPLIDTLARGRGELGRGLSRTGVRGTFRDRALQDFDIAGERALGDQRAIAEQESLTAINSIDQMMFNAQTGVASETFNEELKQLGFGLDTINIINSLANNMAVGAGNIAQASSATQAAVDQAKRENITGAIGSGLSAFGSLSSPKTPTPTGFTGSAVHAGGTR
jgi:hypothetical protein